jgi:hypothetical protein
VNQGGEPGHDDYGLPRVDIEIPDDARALYREVQAYHRELRAIRRQERSRRWTAPLRRSGMVVPLIAGCLVLAMVASMVLTMFSANPYFSGITGPDPSSPAARHGGSAANPASRTPSSSASRRGSASPQVINPREATPAATDGQPLPSETIQGAGGKPLALRDLSSTALVILPARCGCASIVSQLLAQAASAGVTIYLVGKRGSRPELDSLAPATAARTALIAIDVRNVLYTAYQPVGITILLVGPDHSVTTMKGLISGVQLEARFTSLKSAGKPQPAHS